MSDEPRRRRIPLRALVALGVCAGAVVWLVAGPLSSNVTYFRTVSEAVEVRESGDGERFRLMGEVVVGSIRESDEGVHFTVTDGTNRADVVHRGDPPELFGEDIPVVCEGSWQGGRFESDRIMIRHGNEYSPPEVDQGAGGDGG